MRNLGDELDIQIPTSIHSAWRLLGKEVPNSTAMIPMEEQNNSVGSSASCTYFDAFLCHSSHDQKEVLQLAQRLRREQLSVWLDEEQIEPGDFISAKIEDGLRRSAYLLICLSKDFHTSNWSRVEYGSILDKEIRHGSTRVIPIAISEFDPDNLSPLLYNKLCIDVRTQDGFNKLVRKLKTHEVC